MLPLLLFLFLFKILLDQVHDVVTHGAVLPVSGLLQLLLQLWGDPDIDALGLWQMDQLLSAFIVHTMCGKSRIILRDHEGHP